MNHPPLNHTPLTSAAATNATSNNKNIKAECSNCSFNNRGLIHYLHLRGIDRRLCTSCVLRLHPSSFCPSCFEFFEHPHSTNSSASAHRFQSCIKCSSLTHLQCLPSPPPSPSTFLCPPCSNPNFSFFNTDNSVSCGNRVVDKRLALVLLCAAKIASASMTKALNLARFKADRGAREAAVARKKAKEALQHLSAVDKAKRVEGSMDVSGSRNLGTKDSDSQRVLNPGLSSMCTKTDLGGSVGQSKVPLVLPQNASNKNGASDSAVGHDSSFRGNGAVIVNDNSRDNGKLGTHDGDLDRVQSSHGRTVDVGST